jgi:hypothetical protein
MTETNQSTAPEAGAARRLLRHALATLAYRAGKTLRGAPESFARFRADARARTPTEILAHMGDLMDWGLSIAQGAQAWNNSAPLAWDAEVERFFAALERFDSYLAGAAPLHRPAERLFQGPVADALTHAGQLAMLRGLAGCPIRGENYYVADIAVGRTGPGQSAPRREFD